MKHTPRHLFTAGDPDNDRVPNSGNLRLDPMHASPLIPLAPRLSNRIIVLRVCAACIAAVGAAFASGAATDTSLWDGALRVAFAYLFVFVGSRGNPWVLAAAGLVGVLAMPSPWMIAAVAAMFIAVQYVRAAEQRLVGQVQPERIDVGLAAVASALLIQALLRLNERFFFGASSLLVGIAVIAVAISAWSRASDTGRWVAGRAGTVAGVLLAVIIFGAIATLPGGRDAAADGIFATERGLQAARDGDTDGARRFLDLADKSFKSANDRFATPWAKPALLVPILSQHLRALDVASANGSALTTVALDVTESIDVSTMMQSDGGLDVDQLESALPRLRDATDLVATAQADLAEVNSPWLLPALSTRLDGAADDLIEAADQAELASSAAASAPLILGSRTPQHFLVLFGSPSETRELGGILSNWTLMRMDNGSIEQITSGGWQDLESEALRGDGLTDPAGYPLFYTNLDPVANPNNITAIPAITDVARAVADIYPTFFGETLDGVIYVDPTGLAALLEVVGPVSPEGTQLQLESDTLVDFLQAEQYVDFPDGLQRQQVRDSLITQVFSSLGSVQLPGPNRLGDIFGPAARGRHIQMVTFDEDTNDFLRRVDLLQDFARVDQHDFLSVTSTNLSSNKLDVWVDRKLTYAMDIDAVSGELAAALTIEMTSRASTELPNNILGPPNERLTPGQHHTEVVVWTPHNLVGTSVSGSPAQAGISTEYGLNRYTVPVIIDPGGIRTVQLSLAGRISSAAEYELHVISHPGGTTDQLFIDLMRSDGSSVTDAISVTEDVVIALPVLSAVSPR